MPSVDPGRRPFISGIVLAAGASVRMGRPKQLLDYCGRPLLGHAIEAARGSCLDEIVVVLGHRAGDVIDALSLVAEPGLTVVINDDYASGQASSLRLGLRAADPRAVGAAVLLGDQPEIDAATIDLVVAGFAAADIARTPMVRPVYTAGERRVPGHPVVVSRSLWPAIEALRGDQGARVLIAARPELLGSLELAGAAPADIDTPVDYRTARAVAMAASLAHSTSE